MSNKAWYLTKIDDFIEKNKNFIPQTRDEWKQKEKEMQLLDRNIRRTNMRSNKTMKNEYLLKLNATYVKMRDKYREKKIETPLAKIDSPNVENYSIVETAKRTPLPKQKTPSVKLEVEEEQPKVSCLDCFGRKTKKTKKYTEFYGGKSKRKTKKKRNYKKAPKNTRVFRCVQKVKKKQEIGAAIAICQSSTKQSYRTGKTLKKKGGRKKTRRKRGRGKCASKPKYNDEEEEERLRELIEKSTEHMKGQEEKLKKIIDESTCEDGTLDLKRMLLKIKEHQAQQGGAPKFLCGPDKDFVPAAHFARLESIFDKLKEDTTGTALEDIVDKLPSIRKDKGKCYGCKKLIDELVKNTMPSFVGPKILPIKNDDILWLQQFTGVHKGGMCTIMGGRRKKKTRKKRGGEKSKRVKSLIKIFQQYPEIFPSGYFRFLGARLQNHIDKKTLWYKNGVILTWIKYQKTVKKKPKCIIKPGDVKLDQIVNKNQGNGAAKKIVLQFLKKFEKNRIWLEVRANNKRAIRFYKDRGFKRVCKIKFGEIPGIMMLKQV